MSDHFGIQLSVNIPSGEQYEKGDMVNIRGRDAAEFQANLEAFSTHMAERAAQVAQEIRAQYALVRGLGASTVGVDRTAPAPAPAQTPQNAPQEPNSGQVNPWTGAQENGSQNGAQAPAQDAGGIPTSPPPHVGPAPSCSHGVKKFIAKPYKNGKPGYWMAWACPAPRGDATQHDLQFIRQS